MEDVNLISASNEPLTHYTIDLGANSQLSPKIQHMPQYFNLGKDLRVKQKNPS